VRGVSNTGQNWKNTVSGVSLIIVKKRKGLKRPIKRIVQIDNRTVCKEGYTGFQGAGLLLLETERREKDEESKIEECLG